MSKQCTNCGLFDEDGESVDLCTIRHKRYKNNLMTGFDCWVPIGCMAIDDEQELT